jgi:hypothetical protein
MHDKSGSKLVLPTPPRISWLQQDHWSFYTWIYLDPLPTLALVITNMV